MAGWVGSVVRLWQRKRKRKDKEALALIAATVCVWWVLDSAISSSPVASSYGMACVSRQPAASLLQPIHRTPAPPLVTSAMAVCDLIGLHVCSLLSAALRLLLALDVLMGFRMLVPGIDSMSSCNRTPRLLATMHSKIHTCCRGCTEPCTA